MTDEEIVAAVGVIVGKNMIEVDDPTEVIRDVLRLYHKSCVEQHRIRRRFSKESKRKVRRVRAAVDRLGLGFRLVSESEWFEKRVTEAHHLRRDEIEKRLAALAALLLCDIFAVKATKYRNGKFQKLAAVVSGDADARLAKHCSKALRNNPVR